MIRRAAFILVLSMWTPLVAAQSADQLESLLGGGKTTVVLRNYYTDDNLTFDSTGKLVSTGTPGFGPTDGRVLIEQVKLDRDGIILSGKRTVPFYDGSGAFKQLKTNLSVKIRINSSMPPTDVVISTILETIFMKQAELDQMKCTADETKEFRDGLTQIRELVTPPAAEASGAQSIQARATVCLPFGERADLCNGAITPPHWIRGPRIEFRSGPHTGTSEILMIVDTNGNPTSLYIARPLGHGGDERIIAAIRKVRLSPAKFHDTPVPVLVRIRFNGVPD
jgi:hypothetical protein